MYSYLNWDARFLFWVVVAVMLPPTSYAQPETHQATANGMHKPNMVVILVDDMRWDEYSAAGHNFLLTPNIDRMAKEGASFVNAFATTPLCSPSRASFLTGQYPHTNGITDNTARNAQSHQLHSFPKQLHTIGYATAFIGKWHMGNDDSPRPGFDFWASLRGQGEATDPTVNFNGRQQLMKGYVTDVLTDFAVRFIDENHKKPFVLYMAHKALHPNVVQQDDGSVVNIGEGDFVPAPRHAGMYEKSVFNRRANANKVPDDKPALMRSLPGVPPLSAATSTTDKTIRERSEMLMAVDESLGTIMQTLASRGILDNTIIVFTSDHGYWYGEHCLDLERRLAYEEGIRIPMLVRYPPVVKAGTTFSQMALSIDMAPTLMEMAGQKPDAAMQGQSWLPIFKGSATSWRHSFLVEYYSDAVFPRIYKMGYKAVRNDRYKLIRYTDLTGMDELYDLKEDPFELSNVISNPQYKSVLETMKNELNALLKQTNAATMQ